MYHSRMIEHATNVPFPAFTGERIYMRKIFKDKKLPDDLRRWQDTVDVMLQGIDTDNPIFLMVDQKEVKAADCHRRAGVHVDGYWLENEQNAAGTMGVHDGGRHLQFNPGSWKAPSPGDWGYYGGSDVLTYKPEAIILASDVSACDGFIGKWEGSVGEGGEMGHLDLSNMERVRLKAGSSYIGNVFFAHESVPVPSDTRRTVVRLNVNNWEPKWLS